MTHHDVVEGQMIERFKLGELIPQQALEFVQHVFDCDACSEDAAELEALFRNGSVIVAEELL